MSGRTFVQGQNKGGRIQCAIKYQPPRTHNSIVSSSTREACSVFIHSIHTTTLGATAPYRGLRLQELFENSPLTLRKLFGTAIGRAALEAFLNERAQLKAKSSYKWVRTYRGSKSATQGQQWSEVSF